MCLRLLTTSALPLLAAAALTITEAYASTVYVYPSNNLESVANGNPGGTTYELTPGVYRMQSITAKSGDSFIGQSGAVLNGSRLATSFSQQKINGISYWVTTGPTHAGTTRGSCDSAHPMCTYPEDLFINNQPIPRVSSLSAVTANTCYFNYSAGKIYFLIYPIGKTVEIGTTPVAITGTAANVTIKSLIVEKYAAPAQSGAISASTSWTITNNEVRLNHGGGIHMTSYDVIQGNYVHHNGQEGIAGGGNNITLQNNDVGFNNTAGFQFGWEAGGVWVSNSTNTVIKGNYVHNNYGIGIHLDFQSYNWLVQGNRTQNNYSAGIDNEIGYSGTASYNISKNDGMYPGKSNPSMWWGCGIDIYASSGTSVYNNTILNDTNGICAVSIPRGSGNRGAFQVRNLSVTNNVIVQPSGSAAGAVAQSSSDGVYSGSSGNHWNGNTYKLGSGSADAYVWKNQNIDASSWRSLGNDTSGTWISPTDSSFPSNAFGQNQSVITAVTTKVYSLPTTSSTLRKTEPTGTDGTVTKVAGPILTGGNWWWNVAFADGITGWCEESQLEKF
jgi:parallel beta-helix repeat protein